MNESIPSFCLVLLYFQDFGAEYINARRRSQTCANNNNNNNNNNIRVLQETKTLQNQRDGNNSCPACPGLTSPEKCFRARNTAAGLRGDEDLPVATTRWSHRITDTFSSPLLLQCTTVRRGAAGKGGVKLEKGTAGARKERERESTSARMKIGTNLTLDQGSCRNEALIQASMHNAMCRPTWTSTYRR